MSAAKELLDDQKAIAEALDKFKAKHGLWAVTELLLGRLVKFQREGGRLRKVDYAGADFKVTITLK